MTEYQHKDLYALSYEEGVKRLRNEANLITARLMNEALEAWSKQHTAAKRKGQVLELTGARAEIQKYLKVGARRALNA